MSFFPRNLDKSCNIWLQVCVSSQHTTKCCKVSLSRLQKVHLGSMFIPLYLCSRTSVIGRQSFSSLAAKARRLLVLSERHLEPLQLSMRRHVVSVLYEETLNLKSLIALFVNQLIW